MAHHADKAGLDVGEVAGIDDLGVSITTDVRIRRRWHDTQGPTAALENALEIIPEYLGAAGRSVRSLGR